MSVRIFYSGTLVEYDGSDTDVYGESCEPGDGMSMTDGYVDPDWSGLRAVYADRDQVSPDAYTPADGPLIEWLADRLDSRLGGIEQIDMRDDGALIYAGGESDQDVMTGATLVHLAASIEGTTPEIVSAALHLYRFEAAERIAAYNRYLERVS